MKEGFEVSGKCKTEHKITREELLVEH